MSAQRTIRVPRIQHRNFAVQIDTRADAADGKPRSYPLSFSSELPVRQWDYAAWEPYNEILSHEPGDIDLSRASDGLPMMKCHARQDHFGSVNDIALDTEAKRLRGVASFSSIQLGKDQETMLREGHTKTVSVGYKVTSFELVSRDEQNIPTYRCRWMPYEVSTEPVPADPNVGFGRTRGEAPEVDLVDYSVEEPVTEGDRAMATLNEVVTPTAGLQTRTESPAPAPAQAPQPQAPAPITGRDRGAEAVEIMEMAQANGCSARAAEWVRTGLTPDQVSREILKSIRTTGPGQPASESQTVMSPKDRKRYSVTRAIRMQVELMQGERHRIDGLEAEVHQELGKQRASSDRGGILVPWRSRTDEELRTRTLGTQESTGGATLVSQDVMPDMIDLLRNRALILVAGAKFYPGLQGNILFNKKTAAPTVYWMEENPATAATASQPTYGYVSASPKTLIGNIQIPRQLIVQSSIDVEADIRNELASGHALALDLAGLHGSGSDKQPVGIYSAADVQAHAAGGIPDIADVTAMAALTAIANADIGAMSFMTTPAMAGILMKTPVVSGYPLMIWTGNFRDGTIFGWPARATNQMSSTLESAAKHGFIFANWNDMAVCSWGNEIEIVVDILTRASYGQIVINSYSMADIAILRPASFVKATGATIA